MSPGTPVAMDFSSLTGEKTSSMFPDYYLRLLLILGYLSLVLTLFVPLG